MKTLLLAALFGTLSAYASPIQNVYLEGKFEGSDQICRISYKLQEEKGKDLYALSDFGVYADNGLVRANTLLLSHVKQVKKMNLSSRGFIGAADPLFSEEQYKVRMRFSGRDLTDPGSIHATTSHGSFLFGSSGEIGCSDLKVISKEEFQRRRVDGMAKAAIENSKLRCEQSASIRHDNRIQTSGLSHERLDAALMGDMLTCSEIAGRRFKNLQKVKLNENDAVPERLVEFSDSKFFQELDHQQVEGPDSGDSLDAELK